MSDTETPDTPAEDAEATPAEVTTPAEDDTAPAETDGEE